MASMPQAAEHVTWIVATCAAVASLYSLACPGLLQDWLTRYLFSSTETAGDTPEDSDQIPVSITDICVLVALKDISPQNINCSVAEVAPELQLYCFSGWALTTSMCFC